MSAPAITLFGDDDDILADLKDRGVALQQPLADSQLDALASEYLGEMAECDREIARYTEARDAELQRIAQKYEMLMASHRICRERLEAFVCEIAQRADFGKKKSRDVGNGTYGLKKKPEHVKVLDAKKAVAFALKHCPGAVATETVQSVTQKAIQPVVIAYMKTHNGELPDGFDHTSERDVPFAKPDV